MQTLTIIFSIPDGVQFQVNATPAADAPKSQPDPTATKGPTDEDLRRAFMAAVNRIKAVNKDAPITNVVSALGVDKLSDVPAANYEAVIERLNGVCK